MAKLPTKSLLEVVEILLLLLLLLVLLLPLLLLLLLSSLLLLPLLLAFFFLALIDTADAVDKLKSALSAALDLGRQTDVDHEVRKRTRRTGRGRQNGEERERKS